MGPRHRILETATQLFHTQGYNSTGINQIIADARVAKASFYQHFRSKEDLCLAFLDKRHDFWTAELINFIGQAEHNKQRIIAAFDFLIHMNNKENFRGCSFLNILSEISPEQTEILSCIQHHKDGLRKFFKDMLADDLLADHIYLLFESSIIESQVFKSNELIIKSKKIVNTLIS